MNDTAGTTIGTKIDMLYQARAERLDLEAEVATKKAEEKRISEEILGILASSGLNGARGLSATASISHKVRPNVVDWDALYAYIRENGMFELLHKRVTSTLWEAMVADGNEVPGIASDEYVTLSLTKATRG